MALYVRNCKQILRRVKHDQVRARQTAYEYWNDHIDYHQFIEHVTHHILVHIYIQK